MSKAVVSMVSTSMDGYEGTRTAGMINRQPTTRVRIQLHVCLGTPTMIKLRISARDFEHCVGRSRVYDGWIGGGLV